MGDETPQVIMYCRSWCGDCHRALHWLDSKGYEYEVIDIDADLEHGAGERGGAL